MRLVNWAACSTAKSGPILLYINWLVFLYTIRIERLVFGIWSHQRLEEWL